MCGRNLWAGPWPDGPQAVRLDGVCGLEPRQGTSFGADQTFEFPQMQSVRYREEVSIPPPPPPPQWWRRLPPTGRPPCGLPSESMLQPRPCSPPGRLSPPGSCQGGVSGGPVRPKLSGDNFPGGEVCTHPGLISAGWPGGHSVATQLLHPRDEADHFDPGP